MIADYSFEYGEYRTAENLKFIHIQISFEVKTQSTSTKRDETAFCFLHDRHDTRHGDDNIKKIEDDEDSTDAESEDILSNRKFDGTMREASLAIFYDLEDDVSMMNKLSNLVPVQ